MSLPYKDHTASTYVNTLSVSVDNSRWAEGDNKNNIYIYYYILLYFYLFMNILNKNN